MTDLNTFGGRLRAYRKSKKLKGGFAAILRVKKAQVALIEHNAFRTPAEKLIQLATAFPDLDLNWLLTGKGEMLLRKYCLPIQQGEVKVDLWDLLLRL
ncbi:hypothetical protein GCM10023188_44110 [Pontibacter saemangeumensis]|uniref:HTH cro/C1-type domain-containing protein n=1 Tax=Pontibacter saemangeumensis TaxID=1084525 RepID=A0ABP8M3B7_9BACT